MAHTNGMTTAVPSHRLAGSLPRIGIRPTIDGRRRGIRESLEGQTMAMAKAVAEFLTRSLRHPCGLPV
jgi:L-fucose isomerase